MTEKELINGCKTENRVAQQKLYETYASKMLGVCMRYVGDREIAEDLLHDAFITVFAKINDFRGDGSFEGWLRRIFVTTALGYLRKKSALNEAAPIDLLNGFIGSEVSAIEKMEANELLRCIDMLPAGYKVVLNLFAVEGYSHKDIAQMLNISEGTSRSQFARAKVYLHKILKKEDII